MKFEPFIASALFSQPRGRIRFNVPVQLSLLPECQLPMSFALRLHHATTRHFDLRLRVLQTLFSLVLLGDPSLDPAKPVRAKLMGDHDPRYIDSERKIPEGQPGAGPTMPVDLGGFAPILRTYSTYELETLDQISRGDFQFTLTGRHLKGGWQLQRGQGDYWDFQKMDDEHASTSRVLVLDRSFKTGKTLEEI
ncbi:DNA polymerase ligase N-terminal domain-containing protein [Fimbriimonas ginsengisoli]|uniref:DNA ligase D 3'-phosphoesterase domain-containing protein n=1 Tax=Fimbriimonas ginsengisoli Gsoil 348 TaxID=661478 RepID=A0A068NNP5_FIMGI|nr:DNA polymerase ligase N-terminal domain-containing protein [Fimbriimonas ginsengisoli]AIE85022.1 hypothetical protein OP10G_1654 [Fimbriimonas ginsengisoli Gsoil 348]